MKSRETIRAEILEELRVQAELDEKARKWNKTEGIVKAMHKASKLLKMAENYNGQLYIYEGTFEAIMDIYKAIGSYGERIEE